MSGEVIKVSFGLRRAWRIVQLRPGEWQGQLHECGRGITGRTEVGPLWQVEACVKDHRRGLPIYVGSRQPDRGPAAA